MLVVADKVDLRPGDVFPFEATLLSRGECGVLAMAFFEANCATITRFT